ncbi:FG-GAP repeat protein [Caulobacter sp. 17J80-11]|uniref:FG-GAP repeat protein n=1 Tax=Caulobacter sp. 17J80-11 TaxID=2763502 RepID=UPI0016534E3F|nr:FG-GAP repeat protein [Caulobacter sp. 17J80-11]MBC6981364.1 FG-GAP repeat protein [Caulobacter sp. 17J80-11]
MMGVRRVLAVAVGAVAVLGLAGWGITTPPRYVPQRFHPQLRLWLAQHPGYRWADDADCACEDDLRMQRTVSVGIWKAQPDYHPYLAYGDFDGDRREDVAVGVKPSGTSGTYRVLILSGRPASKPFLSQPFGQREAMFFDGPRPEPKRLMVGAFETEGGTFQPAPGGGYRFVGDDCC